MKKDFDFEEIGKKVPYRVPEGFYAEMQEQVFLKTKPIKRRALLLRLTPVFLAMAAVLSAIVFLPENYQNSVRTDKISLLSPESAQWIEDMSDEDLEAMDDITSYDIFMD